MKKKYKLLALLLVFSVMLVMFAIPAFALTESEVEQKVNEVGKEAVTGNILIWFLCSIAFLKISQKIDSFMSSLGVNVGNTGGSMLAEALITVRSLSMIKSFGSFGGFKGRGSGNTEKSSFMKGGLAGAVGRKITGGAVNNAIGKSKGGLGGRRFVSSAKKGGKFANKIIGGVANGSIKTDGSITGKTAENSILSYLGYAGEGNVENAPQFSNVEIGSGRITGTETTLDHPGGIAMAMYSAEQYSTPTGDYTTVTAADNSKWYKQYAADTLVRKPYVDNHGEIQQMDYIKRRLPKPPPRKDRQ